MLGGPDLDTIQGPRWFRSEALHAFLRDELGEADAIFDGAFDVPLQLLVYNNELLQRVLSLSPPPEVDLENRDET
jgi:hypothetical protein